MRILFLTNIPTPYRTTFYNELAAQMSAMNHRLLVLYCAETEPNRNWPFQESDHQYNFKILDGLHPRIKHFYPHFNWSVLREISRFKPDRLVIAGSWNTPTMMLASLASGVKRENRAFWSEGHLDATQQKTGLVNLLRKFIYSRFGMFCVPNKKSRSFIEDYLKLSRRFIALPNTVDGDYYLKTPVLQKEELRARYSLPTNKKLMLQVSQLNDRKGVLELVQGYNLYKSKNPSTQLIIALAGTGPYEMQLQDIIRQYKLEEHVFLLGHRSIAELKELYYASDTFILCTKSDPNPLTPIEAAYCHLPLILSVNAGNASDLVPDEQNGWLLQQVLPEEIAVALEKVDKTTSPALKIMGMHAQHNVMEHFALKKVCANLLLDLQN